MRPPPADPGPVRTRARARSRSQAGARARSEAESPGSSPASPSAASRQASRAASRCPVARRARPSNQPSRASVRRWRASRALHQLQRLGREPPLEQQLGQHARRQGAHGPLGSLGVAQGAPGLVQGQLVLAPVAGHPRGEGPAPGVGGVLLEVLLERPPRPPQLAEAAVPVGRAALLRQELSELLVESRTVLGGRPPGPGRLTGGGLGTRTRGPRSRDQEQGRKARNGVSNHALSCCSGSGPTVSPGAMEGTCGGRPAAAGEAPRAYPLGERGRERGHPAVDVGGGLHGAGALARVPLVAPGRAAPRVGPLGGAHAGLDPPTPLMGQTGRDCSLARTVRSRPRSGPRDRGRAPVERGLGALHGQGPAGRAHPTRPGARAGRQGRLGVRRRAREPDRDAPAAPARRARQARRRGAARPPLAPAQGAARRPALGVGGRAGAPGGG